jgi:hypothetical protein
VIVTETDHLAHLASLPSCRLTAGNCLIHLERKPERDEGSLIFRPDRSRDIHPRDIAYLGTCIKMTPRRNEDGSEFQEEFRAGDWVYVMLLLDDVEREYILTKNTRVYARMKREGEG